MQAKNGAKCPEKNTTFGMLWGDPSLYKTGSMTSMISMLNYTFEEQFSDRAVVTRLRNEHFIRHKDHTHEIKHSKQVDPKQYRHLKDMEKCAVTEHPYGVIVLRSVIYNGENLTIDGIQYKNVVSYLEGLGASYDLIDYPGFL